MVKQVRIVSDGTPRNTSVTDTESGEPVPNAYAFEVRARMGGAVKATIFCFSPSLDVVADAEVIEVPMTGLRDRAAKIAERYGSSDVRAAMNELLGAELPKTTSDSE